MSTYNDRNLNFLIIPTSMNITILGAGAIGSLYGAKLSKFSNVTLVAKKRHADKINKYGLRVIGLENNIYNLKATTKIKDIDNALVLLTTKVYDSKEAINSIKNLIKEGTTILCLQNGLNSEDIVKEAVGNKCQVLRGITSFGAAYLEPGIISCNNYGQTLIEKNAKSFAIAKLFSKCGLNSSVSNNIRRDMWRKLIMNCVLNPLTAILRVENKYIANDRLNSLKKLVINECLQVAEKDGFGFTEDFIKMINNGIKNSANISSMQQDLIKGKRTEIDYLNGAVVKLGEEYGIRCPVNQALVMIIRSI